MKKKFNLIILIGIFVFLIVQSNTNQNLPISPIGSSQYGIYNQSTKSVNFSSNANTYTLTGHYQGNQTFRYATDGTIPINWHRCPSWEPLDTLTASIVASLVSHNKVLNLPAGGVGTGGAVCYPLPVQPLHTGQNKSIEFWWISNVWATNNNGNGGIRINDTDGHSIEVDFSRNVEDWEWWEWDSWSVYDRHANIKAYNYLPANNWVHCRLEFDAAHFHWYMNDVLWVDTNLVRGFNISRADSFIFQNSHQYAGIQHVDSVDYSWADSWTWKRGVSLEVESQLNSRVDVNFTDSVQFENIKNFTVDYKFKSDISTPITQYITNYQLNINETIGINVSTDYNTLFSFNKSMYAQNYFINYSYLNMTFWFTSINSSIFTFELLWLNVTVIYINDANQLTNVNIYSESNLITKWIFNSGLTSYTYYLNPFGMNDILIPTGTYSVAIYIHDLLNYTYSTVYIDVTNTTNIFFYENVTFGSNVDLSALYTYLDDRFNTLFGYIESNFSYTNNYLVEINGNLTSLSTYIGNNFTLLEQYLGSNFTYIDNYLSTLNTYLDGNFTALNNLLDLRFDSIDSYLTFMNFYLESNFTNMDSYYNDISLWFSNLNTYLSTELGVSGTIYTYLVGMNGDLTNYLTLFESSMNTRFDVLDNYFTALNVYLEGNFSLLSSYIAMNFTSLNNRLALYNAWMGSNFTSLMDYLTVLDGYLNANFTNVMNYLNIINNAIGVIDGFVDANNLMLIQLGVDVTNINTKLDFINTWMESNFTDIFSYFNSLDIYFDGLDQYLTNEFGNLTQYIQGNFTTLQTQLYLHDQWMGSNFTSVFAYLDALNGYLVSNFTTLYNYMSGNFTALQTFLGNEFTEVWNNFTVINGYLASNFTDIFTYFNLMEIYFVNLNHTINNTEYNLTAFLTLMGNNTEILDHLAILNGFINSSFFNLTTYMNGSMINLDLNMTQYFLYLNNSINNCSIILNQSITVQYANLTAYLEFFYSQFAGNMTNLITLIGHINGSGGNFTEIITYLNNLNITIESDYTDIYTKLIQIENEILFINGTIYNTKITVDTIATDMTVSIEQNDYLTALYENTLFSIFLNWTEIGRNITKLQSQILQVRFINYDTFNRTLFFRYHDFIITLPLLAKSELVVYIPASLVYYVATTNWNFSKSIENFQWRLVTDDITYTTTTQGYITFGFSLLGYSTQYMLFSFILIIGISSIVILGLYIKYSVKKEVQRTKYRGKDDKKTLKYKKLNK